MRKQESSVFLLSYREENIACFVLIVQKAACKSDTGGDAVFFGKGFIAGRERRKYGISI